MGEGESREVFGRIIREIVAEVKVEDINRIGGQKRKGKEMWLMRLGSEEQKKEVMVKKKLLKKEKNFR